MMKTDKKRSGRCLAGSMAMALLVSLTAAACGTKPAGDTPSSEEAASEENRTKASENVAQSENPAKTSEDGENSSYLAQAKPYKALSIEERAEIDLEATGYSAISRFTDNTLYPLYQTTMQNGAVNFLYSPTSLYLALSVLAECEDTEGAAELYELLGVSDSEELVALVNKMSASLISEGEGDICQIANSLWIEEGYPWYEAAYTTWDTLAEQLAVDIFEMNLHDEEAGIRKNSWISEHTGGLLGNGEPQPWAASVRMVILNTVYFDKSWKVPFEAAFTNDRTFTRQDGTEVTCQMMYNEFKKYDYLETDRYLASVLRYQDGSCMLFMLPQGETRAEELLMSDLTDAAEAYREGDTKQADLVKFYVPKLDYSVSVDGIMEQLEALGISDAFSEKAFTNLADTGLFVSSITQKTCIQVDEKGTKAAAVTEIMTNDSMPMYETVININLDRPYAYAIVSANGTILFSGIVNDPASAE